MEKNQVFGTCSNTAEVRNKSSHFAITKDHYHNYSNLLQVSL